VLRFSVKRTELSASKVDKEKINPLFPLGLITGHHSRAKMCLPTVYRKLFQTHVDLPNFLQIEFEFSLRTTVTN
jgi:hypothetical protein